MKVLMLESHPGVGNHAVAELSGAGHTIVRCDTADRRFPCRGLAGDSCPLDEHVDVAVLVRESGIDRVEHGAVCAARSRVPVVEVEPVDVAPGDAIAPWRAIDADDLLDECGRAAREGRRHAQAVVNRLIALDVVTLAELEGPDSSIVITVERGMNRLQMTIQLADSVRSRELEIVRAATQALRDFDRRPAVIDVSVRHRA